MIFLDIFIGQYYPENEEDDGPGISAVVGEHVTNIMIFLDIFIGQYYPENEEDDGPGISAVVGEHVTNMTVAMSVAVTTKTMLDVESKVS